MRNTASNNQRPHSPGHEALAVGEGGLSNRLAFTPKEFAGFFGKSQTWGYRRLYDGSVKALRLSGSLMIPKSELDRLLADMAIYNGDPAKAPKHRGAAHRFAEHLCQPKGSTGI